MDGITVFSVFGAAIWAALYWLDVNARRRKAAKTGDKPELALMRLFYAVLGIIGQVFFWVTAISLKEWGGN